MTDDARVVDFPNVRGVARDQDYMGGEAERVLLVFFDRKPTDDEFRAFHDFIAKRGGVTSNVECPTVPLDQRPTPRTDAMVRNYGGFSPDEDTIGEWAFFARALEREVDHWRRMTRLARGRLDAIRRGTGNACRHRLRELRL